MPKKIDQTLRDLIEQYLPEIVWAWLILTSVLIRWQIIPLQQSDDYTNFLLPWVEAYRNVSIADALAMDISNYYVPYNLFLILVSRLPMEPFAAIALLSVAADYGMAWMVRRLILQFGGNARLANRCFILTVLLPYIIMNGALWKQCDAVYVFFILWSMTRLFDDRPTQSFILLGVAFAFKLQTVFVLPFYLLLWLIKKNHSIWHYLLIPATYLFAGLPAICAGRPWKDVFAIYKNQIKDPGGIVRNLPNVYYLGLPPYDTAKTAGILFTVAILLLVVYVLVRHKDAIGEKTYLLICAYLAWTCVMFLPGMHERYDYLITLLISVVALVYRDRKLALVALILNLIDVMDYSYFLFYWSLIEPSKLTIPYIFSYVYTGYYLFGAVNGSRNVAICRPSMQKEEMFDEEDLPDDA